MDDDLHPQAELRLRRARQRYTHGRQALVDLLAAASRPLTIAEIIEEGAPQSQSSVYRNLQVLEQAGIVFRIVTADEGGARFELAEDLTNHHHHHMVCNTCGAVEDFTPPAELERALQRVMERASGDSGFTAQRHRVDLVGSCAACA